MFLKISKISQGNTCVGVWLLPFEFWALNNTISKVIYGWNLVNYQSTWLIDLKGVSIEAFKPKFKVGLILLISTLAWVLPCKLATCFLNTLSYERLWKAASDRSFTMFYQNIWSNIQDKEAHKQYSIIKEMQSRLL